MLETKLPCCTVSAIAIPAKETNPDLTSSVIGNHRSVHGHSVGRAGKIWIPSTVSGSDHLTVARDEGYPGKIDRERSGNGGNCRSADPPGQRSWCRSSSSSRVAASASSMRGFVRQHQKRYSSAQKGLPGKHRAAHEATDERVDDSRKAVHTMATCVPDVFVSQPALLTVVTISAATLYGSAFDAGRRSSSQPFQPDSTVATGIRIDAPRSETP